MANIKQAACRQDNVAVIRELRDDENFANLLKAERLDTMPAFLEQRIADGIAI